jgi:hypothetical protein
VFVSASIENYAQWAHNNTTRLMLGVGGLLMLTPFIVSTLIGIGIVVAALVMSRTARKHPFVVYVSNRKGV